MWPLFPIVTYTHCSIGYFPCMYLIKQHNQVVCEYFLVKVKYSVFNICAELLNHDFADIFLLEKVTGPLLIECVCVSVNNNVYTFTFALVFKPNFMWLKKKGK